MTAPITLSNQRAGAGGRGAQTVRRATLLLRLIASAGRDGCRLLDIAVQSGLERPTAHRILRCLIDEGMVTQSPATRRYHLGQLTFELGLAAVPRVDLRQLCEGALLRIAERTGDTVFLTVRSGYDSVCLDRKEGAFPIRTLTLDVGTRRPLGVGAGGMALLMPLADEEIAAILAANTARIPGYANLDGVAVMGMIERARRIGYVLNDRQITPGAMSVGLPVPNPYGPPFAAVSLGAINSRMAPDRQREIAAVLRSEVAGVQKLLLGTA